MNEHAKALGKLGGKADTTKQKKARSQNLKRAREIRWDNRSKGAETLGKTEKRTEAQNSR